MTTTTPKPLTEAQRGLLIYIRCYKVSTARGWRSRQALERLGLIEPAQPWGWTLTEAGFAALDARPVVA